jgi:NAD(P)H-hydrate epimerase
MIRLTREQVREIDRRSIEEYHIPGIVLMENAARSAADVATQMLAGIEKPSVLIFCGSGNNGGDGFAIARHLANRGMIVGIGRDPSAVLKGDAAINFEIVRAMGKAIDIDDWDTLDQLHGCHLAVDALFGTGLSRPLDRVFTSVVDEMNRKTDWQILAIDIPSGLDCNSGRPLGACIRANRTVTFVAEKIGFANPDAKQYTGQITVADIGCPRELIEEIFASTR